MTHYEKKSIQDTVEIELPDAVMDSFAEFLDMKKEYTNQY